MTRRVVARRQFLVAGSGFALALPLLPSLLVDRAYGAEPVLVRRPRLYWLTTNHGGALEQSFFPSDSPATDTQELFADHTISAGMLRPASSSQAGRTALSPILHAPSDLLTPRRIEKLNVLRGLDIPFGIGHHSGGHLGNYGSNEGLGGVALEAQAQQRPTIDQLLAWSPAFYDELSAVRERALLMGSRSVSYGFSNPSMQAGSVQSLRSAQSSLELFHRVFTPSETPGTARVPVVDRVLESYRRLRDGNRRLSSKDRQRLTDHMDRVAELQRKLNAAVPLACEGAMAPSDDSALHATLDPQDAVRYAQLCNEVAAVAFTCGATRIAVLSLSDEQRFVPFAGDWHVDVAHYYLEPDKQDLLAKSYQRVFEHVFLDMLARLDTEEAGGSSYLDNALLVWSQESGMSTHDPVSIPVVMAGGAAGFLRTGQSIDYRRMSHPDSRFQPLLDGETTYAGVTYNQFLATVLQAMGLSRTDFELFGHTGYGLPMVELPGTSLPFAEHYRDASSRYFQVASDLLPFLAA